MRETTWKEELQESIRSAEDLSRLFNLNKKESGRIKSLIQEHPFLITRYYLSLIDLDDPNDPIRQIAIPSLSELSIDGLTDTSGEKKNTKIKGLQHKYSQTALLLLTNRCAVYCRFCFRKRLVGVETEEILDDINNAIDYISNHPEINNVLVSGGDPFILDTDTLDHVLENLSRIEHLKFIRVGSRIPVVFPNRILKDPSLVGILKRYSRADRRLYVVTHFNHPKEITEKSTAAIGELLKAGVIINNQTVLMKHVHDDPAVLAGLQNELTRIGVNPYYVFHCRPVKRVKSHFQFSLKAGFRIVEEAKKQLNGVSKRFKYCMSHETGKIEILGIEGDRMLFKYHQARDAERLGKIFTLPVDDTTSWIKGDPFSYKP